MAQHRVGHENELISHQGATGGTHSFTVEERRSFAEHINQVLANDPDLKDWIPMNPNSNDLFTAVSKGVLLCKFLNKVKPGVIPENKICLKKKPNAFEVANNHGLALTAAKELGVTLVNIGPSDLSNETPHLILGMIWQIIRIDLLGQVSVEKHPEMMILMEEKEDIRTFANITPEQNLLRWFNYHLKRAGTTRRVNNFSNDIKDSECYTLLLNQLAPQLCGTEALRTGDVTHRANLVLQNAEKLGCRKFVNAEDIVNGNSKLNLAFVAYLFNQHPGLEAREADYAEEQRRKEELAQVLALKLRAEEEAKRVHAAAAAAERDALVRVQNLAREEEERRRALALEEEARRRAMHQEEEERKRKWAQEEEARRKAWEDEEKRRRDEWEDAERRRLAAAHEAAQRNEQARRDAEARAKAEEDARLRKWQEEEDARRRQWQADEDARHRAQEEALRKWQEEEDRRLAAEAERLRLEEEARRAAEYAAWQQQQQQQQAQQQWYYQQQQQQQQQQSLMQPPSMMQPPTYYGSQYTTTTTTFSQPPTSFMSGAVWPISRLFVSPMEGRQLVKKDFMGMGKSDPYAVVESRGRRYQTTHQRSTQFPVWGETFEFNQVNESDEVRVSVWDHDSIGKHDFMGEVVIHSADFSNQQKWYPLRPRMGYGDRVSGEVLIKFQVY